MTQLEAWVKELVSMVAEFLNKIGVFEMFLGSLSGPLNDFLGTGKETE